MLVGDGLRAFATAAFCLACLASDGAQFASWALGPMPEHPRAAVLAVPGGPYLPGDPTEPGDRDGGPPPVPERERPPGSPPEGGDADAGPGNASTRQRARQGST